MKIYGEVVELWRYPVKSMLGESCEALEFDSRGVVGDRLFAVRDMNGKFGSGKDTRRFRKIDGLFAFQAHFEGQVPQVKFPDGKFIGGDDPAIDGALSELLGQPVQLSREAEISHMDDGAVHLVTRGSLAALQDVAPEGVADARRFRPNIVLSTDADQIETEWLSQHVRIGEVELKFSHPSERCGMVAFAQDDLAKAPGILRYIAQTLGLFFGVYAEIVKPGVIRIGDTISAVEMDAS